MNTKEEWEERFDEVYWGNIGGFGLNTTEHRNDIKSFIRSALQSQRTEMMRRVKKAIKTTPDPQYRVGEVNERLIWTGDLLTAVREILSAEIKK